MVGRWTVRVGVCGVVGAVVNVMVAWGFVLVVPARSGGGAEARGPAPFDVPAGWSEPEGIRLEWSVGWELSSWGSYDVAKRAARQAQREAAMRELGVELDGGRMPPGSAVVNLCSRAGWPWWAMDGVLLRPTFDGATMWAPSWTLAPRERVPAWLVKPGSFRDASVPLRPVWPGFALDSVFYGVLAYAVVFAPFDARRWRRRRRGRCVACGYDLAGIGAGRACPECGRRSRREAPVPVGV